MPYIATKTNVSISGRKKQVLKERFGEAIELIPGKSEDWLMLSIEDDLTMFFKGDDEPCAICQVQIFGTATEADYAALTERLSDILYDELEIPMERVYVTYKEIPCWGWNAGNL